MKSFPQPLTALEEREYLQKYTEGDLEAKHILIERNLRLVAHIAKKYQSSQEDSEDLLSIGTIGLIKAVVTFNPDKSVRLGTYAARCIENEILMHLRAKKKTTRKPKTEVSKPLKQDEHRDTENKKNDRIPDKTASENKKPTKKNAVSKPKKEKNAKSSGLSGQMSLFDFL